MPPQFLRRVAAPELGPLADTNKQEQISAVPAFVEIVVAFKLVHFWPVAYILMVNLGLIVLWAWPPHQTTPRHAPAVMVTLATSPDANGNNLFVWAT